MTLARKVKGQKPGAGAHDLGLFPAGNHAGPHYDLRVMACTPDHQECSLGHKQDSCGTVLGHYLIENV